jgi:hypothetical protein
VTRRFGTNEEERVEIMAQLPTREQTFDNAVAEPDPANKTLGDAGRLAALGLDPGRLVADLRPAGSAYPHVRRDREGQEGDQPGQGLTGAPGER